MSDWTGYVKTGDQIKIFASIVNGTVYVFSPHTSQAFTVVPGDQWLDVTDIPAIPREKVQAAVDALIDVDRDEFVVAAEIVADHTGVTPTEES
jgi:hypothetical protein